MATTKKITVKAEAKKTPAQELTIQFNKDISAGEKFKVTTREEYEHGSIILSQINAAEKNVDAKYESIYRPIKTGLDALTREFKPLRDRIKAAKDVVRREMNTFIREEESKKMAQIVKTMGDKRLSESTRQERIEAIEVAAPALAGTRKQLVLVVTDINKIPREFFDLNESKLKAHLKDGSVVAGAYVEYQDIVIAR